MRSIPNNEFAALRAEQLAAAARSGDVAAAVALLAAGAEPCRSIDVYGSTALHAAVAGASLPMVRLLLDAAPSEAVVLAGPHADAESPMELGERLARLGQLVNADAVLSALAFAAPRAEENADGEPPISLQIIDALQIIYALHAAVKRSDVHGAMDAIECGSRAAGRDGFDVDHPVDTYGTTALIASIGVLDRCAPDSAVAERARMVFDLLLETGASPTAVRSDDIDAESALEYATRLATRTSSPNGRLVAIAELLRVASAEASTRLAASAAALTPLACVGPAKSPVLLTRAAPRYARAVGDAPSAASAAPTIVACGTTNAAKLACVRSAFTALGWRNVQTLAVEDTRSGVGEQPTGLEETAAGARNRATYALARSIASGAAFGVGVESGVALLGGATFDFCASAVACAAPGRAGAGPRGARAPLSVGLSSFWALPPAVAVAIADGSAGYNDAFERCGVDPDPTGAGVLAALSGGAVTRGSQMGESVRNALLPLRNAELYAMAHGSD